MAAKDFLATHASIKLTVTLFIIINFHLAEL